MGLFDKWNNNKFSIYKSEEKTVLKLIENINNFVGKLAKGIDDNTDELTNKTDLYGDHKGTWQGYRPSQVDVAITSILDEHTSQITELDEHTSQITDMATDNNDYIIYTFFKDNDNDSTSFMQSSDGQNLTRLNVNTLTPLQYRDPSIVYINGWFLVAYTGDLPKDFKISRSKDLITWETFDIDLGLRTSSESKIWAPEWFIDDGKIYILISNRVVGASTVDIFNNTIMSFRPYIAECTDINSLTFNNAVPLNLDNTNQIDPCMIKHNNEYWVFITDHNDKNIESWKCSTINGQYTKVSDNVMYRVEGVSIIKYRDKFYLYGDDNTNGLGLYYYKTSTDLINWTEQKVLNIKERVRHGTAFVVKDKNAKNVISKFKQANIITPLNTKETRIYLPSIATNGIIDELKIIDGMEYYTDNTNITINTFTNKYNAKSFCFGIYGNANITLANTNAWSGSAVGVPKNTKYQSSLGQNDMIIEFRYIESTKLFIPYTPNLTKLANKLETIGPWQNITSFQNNWGAYTGSVPKFYRDRGRVYLQGKISGGTDTTGTVMFYLPEGYRPDEVLNFDVLTKDASFNNILASILIYPDGAVVASSGVLNTQLNLSGISFRAV